MQFSLRFSLWDDAIRLLVCLARLLHCLKRRLLLLLLLLQLLLLLLHKGEGRTVASLVEKRSLVQ